MKENRSNLNRTDNRTYLIGNTDSSTTGVSTEHSMWQKLLSAMSDFVFPLEDKVPAGYYISEIVDVSLRTKSVGSNGEKILVDVNYNLEGCDYKNRGLTFKIKQSYPAGSSHLKDFLAAMTAAGANIYAGYKNFIGVREKVKLAYTSDYSDIGCIDNRVPYVATPPVDDVEDDFGYLDEDDD